jgi:lipopolysaccharide/colanic/teichoic acid biosynthesis glycosyltransferase/glycosyltransferase involved in cell wall biosynthesis
MRVTHLGKFYPPVAGGMERVLQALCEGERELGIDSRALVVGTARLTIHDSVNGVPVTRAGSILRVGSVWFAPALIPLLKRIETDILVLHEPNPMALLAYAIARPKHPLVVWYHSEVMRSRWRYKLIYEPFLKVPLGRAARIVVSSPALMEHAEALAAHRRRCDVIPFGLDITPDEAPAVHPAVRAIRERWNGPVALFVGRLVPYKGVDVLLRALVDVDVAAVIIGDGPLRADLENEAARLGITSRTFFPGNVDDAAVSAWYGACDLFVLPSVTRAETFGLVQLEAMARGKPVISTRLPTGVPWVNVDGVTGLTVPPGDAAALREALGRLSRDADLRRLMGAAARERYLEEFSRPRMVARTRALYCVVLTDPPAVPSAGLKRLFDILLSGTGLILSTPVWAMAAALIKVEDGGPVFYRQDRVGQNGTTFNVLKFRSMVVHAERDHGPLQATAGDSRVTRIGRLMRATAMDELPQLVNIFKGDMSFVGPRALRPGEIEALGDGKVVAMEDIEGYKERTAVQPGLTGVAQIYAPRDVTRRHKFRYDRVYVKRRSFWLDIRLILLSFWISMRGTWEHRQRKF